MYRQQILSLSALLLLSYGCLSAPQRRQPQPASQTVKRQTKPTVLARGEASFYGAGEGFKGKPTASGEPFNPADFTAAHRTLEFGTRVKVRNEKNGRETVVRINDRGPFVEDRIIDLSAAAARQLEFIADGTTTVTLFRCPEETANSECR